MRRSQPTGVYTTTPVGMHRVCVPRPAARAAHRGQADTALRGVGAKLQGQEAQCSPAGSADARTESAGAGVGSGLYGTLAQDRCGAVPVLQSGSLANG